MSAFFCFHEEFGGNVVNFFLINKQKLWTFGQQEAYYYSLYIHEMESNYITVFSSKQSSLCDGA